MPKWRAAAAKLPTSTVRLNTAMLTSRSIAHRFGKTAA
jgi:hypothetical protein